MTTTDYRFLRTIDERCFDFVIHNHFVTKEKAVLCLHKQIDRPHVLLIELMRDLGLIREADFFHILQESSLLPVVDLTSFYISPDDLDDLMNIQSAHTSTLVFQKDESSVHIALADPEDLITRDSLQKMFNDRETLFFQADSRDIKRILQDVKQGSKKTKALADGAEQNFISRVDELIIQAVHKNASDIHIQPFEQFVDIKCRLDGVLYTHTTIQRTEWEGIVIRLKVMAGLDIAESRSPQNGHFNLQVMGRPIDFRLSCHPTIFGENLVLRILDKTKSLIPLSSLGYDDVDQSYLTQLLYQSQGIIFLCGPTGSGKTTTLYALINEIKSHDRNIMTLEDPVEYKISGIRQSEVTPHMSFGAGVRSILRQDPDVILIGEVRDEDTAQMAIRASMTGHLVLTTIHTNDSLSVIQRLIDLGVHPHLLKGNILSIVSQRLVRKLCVKCKKKQKDETYISKGCIQCSETGYQGRQAIVEVFKAHHHNGIEYQDWTITKHPKDFKPLRQSAQELITKGITSEQEVKRIFGDLL